MVEVDARPLATWLATRHLPQPCRDRLFVASPDFVADFLGDHSVADMEVVQQAHLHLGADGERAIIEAVARDAKCSPRVIEYAVGRREDGVAIRLFVCTPRPAFSKFESYQAALSSL